VLGFASTAPQPGETIFQTTTIEERFDDGPDDRTERARLRLETLLVDSDVAVEVLVKDSVEGGALGMERPVDGGPVGDDRGLNPRATRRSGSRAPGGETG
jgi:hypothetical protein